MDAPYRVDRSIKGSESTFTIMHTADGDIGTINNLELAYKIVELLNEDVKLHKFMRTLSHS